MKSILPRYTLIISLGFLTLMPTYVSASVWEISSPVIIAHDFQYQNLGRQLTPTVTSNFNIPSILEFIPAEISADIQLGNTLSPVSIGCIAPKKDGKEVGFSYAGYLTQEKIIDSDRVVLFPNTEIKNGFLGTTPIKLSLLTGYGKYLEKTKDIQAGRVYCRMPSVSVKPGDTLILNLGYSEDAYISLPLKNSKKMRKMKISQIQKSFPIYHELINMCQGNEKSCDIDSVMITHRNGITTDITEKYKESLKSEDGYVFDPEVITLKITSTSK